MTTVEIMIEAKKSFGQHFLRDVSVVRRILEAANPEEFALTLEVGPGQGALTGALVKRKKEKGKSHLVLVEADRDLIPGLQKQFPHAVIVRADAAQADYAAIFSTFQLFTPWLLVGNLPYNAANAIIMHALESPQPPERMVVMVQKEVGERLLGLHSSDRGLLTVAVQMYADVERICTVKPGAFVPPPAVDSMVVRLTRRPSDSPPFRGGVGGGGGEASSATSLYSSLERRRYADVIRVAKAGFSSRRKQLHGNLAQANIAPSATTKHILVTMGLPPTARAEELTIAQWTAFVERLT